MKVHFCMEDVALSHLLANLLKQYDVEISISKNFDTIDKELLQANNLILFADAKIVFNEFENLKSSKENNIGLKIVMLVNEDAYSLYVKKHNSKLSEIWDYFKTIPLDENEVTQIVKKHIKT